MVMNTIIYPSIKQIVGVRKFSFSCYTLHNDQLTAISAELPGSAGVHTKCCHGSSAHDHDR